MRRLSKRRQNARGQASAEFLLSAVFLIGMILAIIEFSVYLYTYVVVADAAKEGVRYAVVHGCGTAVAYCSGNCSPYKTCTDAGGANVKSAVTSYAGFLTATNVTVTWADGNANAASRVQVTVSYPYIKLFGLGWTPSTIKAAAIGRIMN